MFDLITGSATHIPSKPAVPVLVSIAAQAGLVAAVLAPVLLVTGQLPHVPTMMAFVAAAPAPPPPPPPPPAPAAKTPSPPTAKPTSSPDAAPVAEPANIAPERAVDEGDPGVAGGVEGGIPGGVVGGVLGGLLTEIPPPPPPPPPAEPRAPVRVGGQIQAPTLLHRVEPVYPVLAVHANIRGTVILEAIVAADGHVASVTVLRSAHRMLDDSAVAAVRQWQYSPVILNGIPERFVLTVVLSFNLTEAS